MSGKPWFIILGAGASVDSGLPTFRGPGGVRAPGQQMTSPETFKMLKNEIHRHSPGETYRLLKEVTPPGSYILNQNIDGYAQSIGVKVVDMHVRGVNTGVLLEYEDMVQYGQSLPDDKVQEMMWLTKKGIDREHGRAGYVLVIGTSLQFPYLREFITRVKKYGAKVVHINPDPDYAYNIDADFKHLVRKNEVLIDTTSAEALQMIAVDGIDAVIEEYSEDC